MIVSEATPISHGAIRSKVSDGVSSSRPAPRLPPSRAATASSRTRSAWPSSSAREPSVDPTLEKTSATVFVTLAATGPRPTASSAG